MTPFVSAVVEGDVDGVIIRRLAAQTGLEVATLHVKRGKQNIHSRIAAYNAAARQAPFIVLVDLDREYDCAPSLIAAWLPNPQPLLRFRVAVHAAEAWLLGDRERAARFLRVKQALIPEAPETASETRAR